MQADAELDVFRQSVNCASVLERMTGGWTLDARESSRRALKYRRGPGEIIIVNHEGRGWWDPTSTAKGDVFTLVQHLDPSLNFGAVRKVLRRFVGIAPAYPEAMRVRVGSKADKTPAQRWAERKRLTTGDPAWRYLAGPRALPANVLTEASRQDVVRLGAYGGAWFAHRWHGEVTHVEIRSANFRCSLRGGRKTLFQFGEPTSEFARLAVLEAPIDALSLAAIEGLPSGTIYVATGGGMGPITHDALRELIAQFQATPGVLVSAADADGIGDLYAIEHAALAEAGSIAFKRLRPPEGKDWNNVLVEGRDA